MSLYGVWDVWVLSFPILISQVGPKMSQEKKIGEKVLKIRFWKVIEHEKLVIGCLFTLSTLT